jgi:shikimate dehydrogenase
MATSPVPITGRTTFLGIIADPVVQARAPGLVNAALAARGHDAVLVPMQVRRDDLAGALAGLRLLQSFGGAVVSMPHKMALHDLLDEVTPEGRQVGACNVVRREADGTLVGTMFDGEGFVEGLRRAGYAVRGRRVFVAGAGGAAAAIACALGKHGVAGLTLHNRTRAKAEVIARRVCAAWPEVAIALGADPGGHDLVVNATALGMQPGDPLPLDVDRVAPDALAAEVVITPRMTPFLEAAARRGCAVHHGEPMLAAQIDLMIDFMLP